MKKTVLISGSLAFDRIMDFPGKFSDHILPEKIHILNVSFTINGLRENFGGTAGNIAYSLALLGERPRIAAAAGRDFDPYRVWLERNGLSAADILISREELTASAYITTDLSDNQITAFNPGAMKCASDFDFAGVDPTGTLAIVAPGNLEDMRLFSAQCRETGIPYIFDPGQSLPAWSGEELAGMITGSTIFISNDYELEMTQKATGLSREGLLALTGAIVTTRGEHGSLVCVRDGETLKETVVPVVPPDDIRDPTGAGDAYRAGLLKGLLLDEGDLVRAARMGAACAAYAVESYGTQTFRFDGDGFNRRHAEAFGSPAFVV